ncbi:thioredoxin domain-containing protein [Candidatus Kaiserbacteria bacterium]|nr:thioredoxin domain-containing protein [Candidatus Kaiserbacteria bacterium]USN91980.1 MAG: thioredoxin domain-containing protein [Candidatus Nomurabacteria bacterium]
MKNPWVIICLITIILFGGAFWYSKVVDNKNNEGVEIVQNIKGNVEARVRLVEYSDFQCPSCASFQPIMDQIFEEFSNDVNLEYKHFPLYIHQYARQASVAAEAAGQQGKFFEFHDMLFERQVEWSSARTPDTLFVQYASELELDIPKFKRHMKSSVLRDKVNTEFEEGRQAGVTGTPTLFLNGEIMKYDSYQSLIEQVAFAVNPESKATSGSEETKTGVSDVKFGL